MKKIYEMIVSVTNSNFRAFSATRRKLFICSVFLLAFLFAGARASAFVSVVTTSVSLTAPFDGETFLAPASIALKAEASSTTGTITTVGFYNGTSVVTTNVTTNIITSVVTTNVTTNVVTTLIGAATNAPYTYMWANVATGSYSLTARAMDNSGAVSTSAVAAIQVFPVVINTTNFTKEGAAIWQCPDNVTSVVVECWGAGGAGGSAQYSKGGGGAGGAYARYDLYAVVPGRTYYINVGAGGANNFAINDGRVPGGDSWFNTNNAPSTIIIAKGGAGGESAISNIGLGGTGTKNGSAGNVVYAGGSGSAGASGRAGGGGSSAGTNAAGTTATSNAGATAPAGGGNGGSGPTTSSVSGGAGSVPGGGGAGAGSGSVILEAGGKGGSGKVVLTYKANVAPVVSLTAPVLGGKFIAPASIAMTANASDADGVIKNVGFYNGVNLIASVTNPPYAYTWTNVASGIYNIKAQATDNSGAVSISPVASIMVLDPSNTLTVISGSGSGSYTNKQRVTISADAPAIGKAFYQWIGDTQVVDNVTYTNALVTMSTNPVTLTATYTDAQYTLTVNSGSGDGSYTNGRQVGISADTLAGKLFDQWTGAAQYIDNVTQPNAVVTMPASSIAVTATYKDAYVLTVTDGTGDGLYTNGTQVAISADAPVIGKAFDRWAGDTQVVNDVTYTNALVTMSANPAHLIATYTDAYYLLTVNGGTGAVASATNGTQVEISADAPPAGMTFDRWAGDAQVVASGTSATTTVTMPAQAVALTATYKDLPGGYTLTVTGGTGSGSYTNGQQVTVTAVAPGGKAFDRWTGDTQIASGIFSLSTIVTMPAQNAALTASFVDASDGVVNINWALSGILYSSDAGDQGILGPTGSGKSTIAQLMYSPDDIRDSILPNRAGAVNDVVLDTVTITEDGTGLYEYGNFSASTVRAWTNGYVYALIFQDNNVQAGDWYFSTNTPLMALEKISGGMDPQKIELSIDMEIFGDVINGTNSAQVVDGIVLTVVNGSGSGMYTNGHVQTISASNAPSGQVFDHWAGDTAAVANSNAASTTVTMSAANIAVTAMYKNLPGHYTLTVTGGTGSGAYVNGQQVAITAVAASGMSFVQWIGATQYVASASSASTTVNMPAQAIALTATYTNIAYALTVAGGTGGGSYTTGTEVEIAANAPAVGKVFVQWIGDTQYVAGVNSSIAKVTMPAQAVILTAMYTDVYYGLTVTSGSGDGSYTNGRQVGISADAPIAGKAFDRWIGATQYVASANSASTTVTMPAQAIDLTATYVDAYYTLTVNSGAGGSSYTNGTKVLITASNAPTGQAFDRWIGDVQVVESVTASNTTVTMPAQAVSLTATYKTVYTLTVINGTGNGAYTNGQRVAISAYPGIGTAFARWAGNTAYLANSNLVNTTVTMPASNITVTAIYTNLPGHYTLAVTNGTGSGAYTNGALVEIAANAPAIGTAFDRWTGNTQVVASVTASNTTVTMPAGTNAVTLTATYTNLPGWNTLTVNSGRGGGAYTNGQQVAITADAPASGKTFSHWTGDTQFVDNVTSTNALVTMSTNPVALTATYNDTTHVLTVTRGAGTGSYTNLQRIAIAADAPAIGTVFVRWTGDTQYLASVTASNTTVTMPASNIAVTATYKNVYVLTVTNGTGGGIYTNMQVVAIAASNAPSGMTFVRWIGDTQVVASVIASTTTVTMPAQDVSLTATYANGYALTVEVGTGSGTYTNGALVAIMAGEPTPGKTFDQWTGSTQYLARVTSSNTTVTMPATNISVKAKYKVAYYALTVNGGTGDGSYTNGQRVTIKATVPSGMKFANWNDGNTNVSRVIAMPPAPATYTANFIDIQKPTVRITFPAQSHKVMTNGTVVIRGTAADNHGLDRVMCQLYTGEWTNAVTTNGWKNWTANYTPVSGLNTARVYSVDMQGNVSATSRVVFTYVPGAVVQVQTNGAGTITPAYNGKVLQIGKKYQMTAKATSGVSVFTNWTYGIGGTVATNKAAITFVMQSNLVLTANFRSLTLSAMADTTAMDILETATAAITVDGSAEDWANVPCSSFSYASVTQEVAVALDGNNVALLMNGCPFGTSDTVLVYFKLRLSYGIGDNRHSVDLWTSGSVLYGMVDGQVIAGLEAVLLNGVLEVKLPVEQAPSQVTIEEVGCGMDLGGGTLTELFKLTPPPASIQ